MSLLERFQVTDVQDLARFTEAEGFTPMRHQVSDVLQAVNLELARYERMRELILAALGDDYHLTISTMTGPFFKAIITVFGEAACPVPVDLDLRG